MDGCDNQVETKGGTVGEAMYSRRLPFDDYMGLVSSIVPNQPLWYYQQQNPYSTESRPQYDTGNVPSSLQSHANMIPQGRQAVEMHVVGSPETGYTQQQTSGDPNTVLNECRAIGRAIDDLGSRLGALQRSQSQYISSSNSIEDVNALSVHIYSTCRALADRVKRVRSQPESQDPRNKPQVDLLNRRIRKAINSYQQVESRFGEAVYEHSH
jgi:syntaxin 1B/2/3